MWPILSMMRDPIKVFGMRLTGASAAVAPLPDVLTGTAVPTVLLLLIDCSLSFKLADIPRNEGAGGFVDDRNALNSSA
jgi:hypothetical protein